VCLGIEFLDEDAADDLALLFRVFDALQGGEEALFGVYVDHVHLEMCGDPRHDFLCVDYAQQSDADGDADQPLAKALLISAPGRQSRMKSNAIIRLHI